MEKCGPASAALRRGEVANAERQFPPHPSLSPCGEGGRSDEGRPLGGISDWRFEISEGTEGRRGRLGVLWCRGKNIGRGLAGMF